jgi:methylmalonyl-CoA mutase N-terminal domain/subunit
MLEGVLAGIERGYFQQEIAESAFAEQTRFEHGDLVKVGVNRFVEGEGDMVDVLEIPHEVEVEQIERVRATRARRDAGATAAALDRLSEVAAGDGSLVEPLVDCARAACTEGEIVAALEGVFGRHTEIPAF